MGSIGYIKEKRKQWDYNHGQVGSPVHFVTGTNFEEVMQHHHLPMPTNKLVLDIGIGTGQAIRRLKENKNRVIACDVSKVALDHSSEWWDESCLTQDLNKLEPVDLAVCHLVMQHNHEEEVVRIINDVNLKEGGVFSFQFSCLHPEKSNNLSKLIIDDINRGMLFFYSSDKMEQMVGRTNKTTYDLIGPTWFDDPFLFEWYVMKVKMGDCSKE
jgi:SAM-dependent methyltransferase